MNAKQNMWIATLALAVFLGTGAWNKEAGASVPGLTADKSGAYDKSAKAKASRMKDGTAAPDAFRQALGAASDEEIYEGLYGGKSLAAIAADNGGDVQALIDLQVAELTEQLDLRLVNGGLSRAEYDAQKSELREIVTRSAHGSR